MPLDEECGNVFAGGEGYSIEVDIEGCHDESQGLLISRADSGPYGVIVEEGSESGVSVL